MMMVIVIVDTVVLLGNGKLKRLSRWLWAWPF